MNNQQGITLVEFMIGVVVAVMVMMAVIASARYLDTQKRLTVGANGALESLSIETNHIATDIRMAGHGMVFGDSFFCKTFSGELGFLPPVSVKSINGTSDALRLVYVDSPYGIASTTLKQTVTGAFSPSQLNYDPGNVTMILVKDASEQCSVLTNTSSALSNPIPIGSVAIPVSTVRDVTYSINSNRLMELDNRTGTNNEVASNIIFMKVYALINDVWVPAADNYLYTTTTSLSAQYGKTAPSALKIFLIAREANFTTSKEKSGACLANTQTTLEQGLPWKPSVDGPAVALNGNWKCYNYQGFELVVPLINIALGAQSL